jgi:CHAT domain-containing protein
VGDKAGEATTLNYIGRVYSDLAEKQKALEFYNQSLPLSRAVGNKAGEAANLGNIASVERKRGNLNEALTQIQAAIKIIEELRTKIASQQLCASYFATVQGYYQFYIDLLMQLHKTKPSKGYDALALHISERSKARSLLELLAEANVNIGAGADPRLREQERNLQQQLNAAEQSRIKLLEGSYTEKQLTEIKQRIENLITQLDQVQAQIRVKSPAYAAISQPGAFTLTLPQIQQQVLDDDTLLLTYSLGKERSYLWAVTKTGFTSYELPKRADIEAAAKEFRQVLTDANPDESEIATSAAKLSQLILTPVANQLGNKRLLVVSDGILQYIPFAALPVPANSQPTPSLPASPPPRVPASSYTPLLVQNEVVSLPSASTLAVLRNQVKDRPQAAKILAAIADPVFTRDHPRFPSAQNQQQTATDSKTAVMRACESLDRLEFSGKEADNILALAPGAKRFAALGFDASRANATRADLSQYQIVHFATHGCVNEDHPELSGVALSQFEPTGVSTDGFLRLHDIFNLNLGAELVVLSACKTGIGKEVQGEGLLGLTRGFMYARAKRVVVSLWSVNDAATSQLMQKYYQQMLQKPLNTVQALRAAQL